MSKHFIVLVVGSVLFLIQVLAKTWTVTVAGSHPDAVAAKNSAIVIQLLGLFGFYAAFVVLVLAHGLLPRRTEPTDPRELADPAREPNGDG